MLNERIKINVNKIDKLYFENDKMLYEIYSDGDNVFQFETKKIYEDLYDSKFEKTNRIGALVEFINNFNNKIVISNIRFMRRI